MEGETMSSDDNGNVFLGNDDDSSSNSEDESEVGTSIPGNNTELLASFQDYVAHSQQNRYQLPPEIEAGVSLFSILSNKRVPLCVYDAIYKWHTQNLQATEFVGRETLMNKLNERYNMERCRPFTRKVELPHSHARIDLVCHDMGSQIQSLLTDPRITDEDFLFHNDDPLSEPPKEFRVIGDINTGLAYRKTHQALIQDPSKEVLLPIIFYMDGATTGSDGALPIEALQFTLGIFKSKTREKVHAWRSIGYIKNYLKEDTQAQDILKESTHLDAGDYVNDSESEDETNPTGNEDKYWYTHAQDLHAMLDILLTGYRELEKHGIEWRLPYKGKIFRVKFVLFTMYIKGDSQEHDKHCGHFTSRTEKIKQLCRYCTCPNERTDDVYQDWPLKNQRMIEKLASKGDKEGLRQMSQQLIENAWYSVRWGQHDKRGVHGACPMEILHWIQLGKFGKLRDMFTEQTGDDTILSREFNVLGKTTGLLLKRQSDRTLPRVYFSRGFQKGKLTAQEYTGLFLTLLATMCTTAGTNCLINKAPKNSKVFGKAHYVQDWVTLIETMLQMEAWLCLPEIPVYDVRRFKTKVKEILQMEKAVGKRQKGMKFRTLNFHAAVHVPDDMLNYGVANNVNTRCNEEHHKRSITAAKRTQKRAKIFDLQCGKQLHNMHAVDLGIQEVYHDRPVWDYYYTEESGNTRENGLEEEQPGNEHELMGVRSLLFWVEEMQEYRLVTQSRMAEKWKHRYEVEETSYLVDILISLGPSVKELTIYTEHKRHKEIFRATPRLNGKPWRDWVMVKWGRSFTLPAQIRCFVDLRNVPENTPYNRGIYAVIESAEPDNNPTSQIKSNIFKPYLKESTSDNNGNTRRKFYFIDVEAFASTACVIPDLENEKHGAFLVMAPRDEWSDQFTEWLHDEHTREFDQEESD
jgi:hypothetical protein